MTAEPQSAEAAGWFADFEARRFEVSGPETQVMWHRVVQASPATTAAGAWRTSSHWTIPRA